MHKLQQKYEQQINELVKASVHLGDIGYVTSHGGNLSLRVDENVVLITPTKVPKRELTFDDIVIINFEGEILFSDNGRKPTGETPIHLNILSKRPDVKGLVHAHPPVLTGFSLLDAELLSRPLLPEPIIELGPVIYVAYEEPLSQRLAAAFDSVVEKSNAFLMKNHGVMICSPDGVWRALELLEMLENMAYSAFVAASMGKVNQIPLDEVDKLERTIRTRNLPMPGKPGVIKKLSDAYKKFD
jgi:L-fuculose-phosphate aldolase